ncbi:hypothetical protein COOONC_13620 [Cooperia oncophora]
MTNVLRTLISDISGKLGKLREEAVKKERWFAFRQSSVKKKRRKGNLKAAQSARDEIKRIEDQLRELLGSPSVVQQGQQDILRLEDKLASESTPLGPSSSYTVEKGKCKFNCYSTTHQYATDCDVYATLSDRRDRMKALHLCFKCFQQCLEPDHDSKCVRVPCFYCSQKKRLGQVDAHLSVLCPYMFPQ